MTNEEAIEILDVETTDSLFKYENHEEAVKEACKIAVAALRAQKTKLDRSRWEWCFWRIGFCPEVTGDTHWDYRFCPKCGRPLTEEAWAELERRINGG